MTARIFCNVKRGITDATAVCVYPWEKRLLQHIHGPEVEEVSIDKMSDIKGFIKKEKIKFKYDGVAGPDLRQQLEGMVYVDPEDDPALDPASEYARLEGVYGMDNEVKMAVVTVIYGHFDSGGFEKVLQEFAQQKAAKPMHMKAAGEGLDKAPSKMNVGELREALTARNIDWETSEGKSILREKLEGVLVE